MFLATFNSSPLSEKSDLLKTSHDPKSQSTTMRFLFIICPEQSTIHLRICPIDQLFCDKRKSNRLNMSMIWYGKNLVVLIIYPLKSSNINLQTILICNAIPDKSPQIRWFVV